MGDSWPGLAMLKWPRNAFMADFRGFYSRLNNLDGNHRDGIMISVYADEHPGRNKVFRSYEKHLVSLFRLGSDHG